MNDVREEVRERYASSARAVTGASGGCGCGRAADCGCADGCCTSASTGGCCSNDQVFGAELYDTLQRDELPETAVLASLGCGNPTAVADLREGQTVLDLGSGGGIDVLLSAKRVGPTGKAYGLDMTEEMLALANDNKRKAGATNVEFLKGYIEEIPLPASTVDVVISNCVINLSTDKPKVFAEMARVLKPGGRLGISDVIAADHLTPEQRAERGSFVGCIAGALSFAEYEHELHAAGFADISITPTHAVADEMFSSIVKATRWRTAEPSATRELTVLQPNCC
jgi:ubiquinone/menaquinone biosynthesis C-methylase UbiE